MRIWILGDTHFGIYPIRTEKWLSMMTDYFYKECIPFFKKYVKDGDILIHLGDVYDNRTAINVKVNNEVVKLFEQLSIIFKSGVYVLNGNHDNYNTNYENAVQSTISIKHIPNIHLISNPTQMTFDNKVCTFLPWIDNENELKKHLLTYSGSDILFCHSDLNGCRTQAVPTRRINQELLELDSFTGYKEIYSGHIHIRQTIGNFNFVGTPYHLDRNDKGNEKGIHCYDTIKNKTVFIKNNISPEFISIFITKNEDLLKVTNDICNKNYIDLYVNKSLKVADPTFVTKIDKILANRKIESISWIEEEQINEVKKSPLQNANLDTSWDILDLSKKWVDSLKYTEDKSTNELIKSGTLDIITKAQSIYIKTKQLL